MMSIVLDVLDHEWDVFDVLAMSGNEECDTNHVINYQFIPSREMLVMSTLYKIASKRAMPLT